MFNQSTIFEDQWIDFALTVTLQFKLHCAKFLNWCWSNSYKLVLSAIIYQFLIILDKLIIMTNQLI